MGKKNYLDHVKLGLLQVLEKVQNGNLSKEELANIREEQNIYKMMIDVEKVETDKEKNKLDFVKMIADCNNPMTATNVAYQLGVIENKSIDKI